MKNLIITIIIILVVFLAVLFIIHPEWLEKVWMWLVGFAGIIGASFKKIANFFKKGRSIKEIDEDNERIKNEFLKIKNEINDTNERLKRERDIHSREIVILEKQLSDKKLELEKNKQLIDKIKKMTPIEYIDSLSEEEKKKFKEETTNDIRFY